MESTEQIVKTFLELKGYLVLNNHKVKVDKNVFLDLDIIAIRNKNKERDSLPDRIIGEVKSWKLHPVHLPKFCEKNNLKFSRMEEDRLKYLNNPEYKKNITSQVNKRYGKGFKIVIFAQEIIKKYNYELSKFLNKEKIIFVSHNKIVNYLLKNTSESTYVDDPVIQFIRLMKKSK